VRAAPRLQVGRHRACSWAASRAGDCARGGGFNGTGSNSQGRAPHLQVPPRAASWLQQPGMHAGVSHLV
jgi:hypothetical protein